MTCWKYDQMTMWLESAVHCQVLEIKASDNFCKGVDEPEIQVLEVGPPPLCCFSALSQAEIISPSLVVPMHSYSAAFFNL